MRCGFIVWVYHSSISQFASRSLNLTCYLPTTEHGDADETFILPSLQVALVLLLMWSAGQVVLIIIVISTPCLTGKAGFVTTLLHAVSRVLQSENEDNCQLWSYFDCL
jgi:hypothetical protein